MTDLQFPGGLARLDNDAVWQKLEQFRVDGGHYVLYGDAAGLSCVVSKGVVKVQAFSRLGPADAVAGALQAFERAQASEPGP